jgi:hypothetical protein
MKCVLSQHRRLDSIKELDDCHVDIETLHVVQ